MLADVSPSCKYRSKIMATKLPAQMPCACHFECKAATLKVSSLVFACMISKLQNRLVGCGSIR
jgi:hypothetical protein